MLPSECDSPVYYIRAVVQEGATGPFIEVPGSRTWVTHNVFLSKSFEVSVGHSDIFKYQWQSPCIYLALTPVPIDNPLLGALHWHDEDTPTDVSATVVISNT